MVQEVPRRTADRSWISPLVMAALLEIGEYFAFWTWLRSRAPHLRGWGCNASDIDGERVGTTGQDLGGPTGARSTLSRADRETGLSSVSSVRRAARQPPATPGRGGDGESALPVHGSCRRAFVGSIREARHAGSPLAKAATATKSVDAPTSTPESVGARP